MSGVFKRTAYTVTGTLGGALLGSGCAIQYAQTLRDAGLMIFAIAVTGGVCGYDRASPQREQPPRLQSRDFGF
jgi:hypothetical protein